MEQFVKIKHPKTDGVGEVTENAFNKVYKPKGWKLAESSPKAAPPTTLTKEGKDEPGAARPKKAATKKAAAKTKDSKQEE